MTRQAGPRRMESTAEVAELEPPQSWFHGIGKLLLPLVVRRQAQREMPENAQRLKERLELARNEAPSAAASRGAR